VPKAMQINALKNFQVALAILLFCNSAIAFQWPENKKSAVSLTSDDGWNSQLLQAAILDSRGIKGTFYLAAVGTVTLHAKQWAKVHRRGHEVGNHSFSHWNNKILATKTKREVAIDIGSMEAWLLHNIYGKCLPTTLTPTLMATA
jgi:peptidoglycan/xylan/chitin deacetylase (PgdA/CDA1 family)